MAVYAVMLRLDYGSDYNDRYSKTVDVIRTEGGGTNEVWEEPTSTYILKSTKNTQDLLDAIYFAAPIYDSKDLIVVVNLSAKGYAQKGAAYPSTLKNLMDAR